MAPTPYWSSVPGIMDVRIMGQFFSLLQYDYTFNNDEK
jgi:hypothetical protein